MADRYLPASTACGSNCSKASTADPEEGLDVGARMGLAVCTPTHGNADALSGRFARCGCCNVQRETTTGAHRWFLGKVMWVCAGCTRAIDINRAKP